MGSKETNGSSERGSPHPQLEVDPETIPPISAHHDHTNTASVFDNLDQNLAAKSIGEQILSYIRSLETRLKGVEKGYYEAREPVVPYLITASSSPPSEYETREPGDALANLTRIPFSVAAQSRLETFAPQNITLESADVNYNSKGRRYRDSPIGSPDLSPERSRRPWRAGLPAYETNSPVTTHSPPEFPLERHRTWDEISSVALSRPSSPPIKEPTPPVKFFIDYIAYQKHRNGVRDFTILETIPGGAPKPVYTNTKTAKKDVVLHNHIINIHRRVLVDPFSINSVPALQHTVVFIESPYLAAALETVVREAGIFDPEDLKDGRSRVIDEAPKSSQGIEIIQPYPMVVYHLDELQHYAENHPNEDSVQTTVEHIKALLDFINTEIGKELEEEKRLNSLENPMATYKWIWRLFKPGQRVYSRHFEQAYTLQSITPSTSSRKSQVANLPPESYTFQCKFLGYQGSRYQEYIQVVEIWKFEGPQDVRSLAICPEVILPQGLRESVYAKILARGKRMDYIHKMSPAHMEYDGMSADGPVHLVQSRVVIDYECYLQQQSESRSELKESPIKRIFASPRAATGPRFADRDNTIDKEADETENIGEDLMDDQILLLPSTIHAWVLKDRRWALLYIDSLDDVIPDKDIFEMLILPENRVDIIKALVQSHKRSGPTMNEHQGITYGPTGLTNEPYSADHIKGKGQGLLVLLHGPPGTGKTSTAESVAEYTSRPLFPITCGDLGTDVNQLEGKLSECFRLAQRWGAVLLLDEADVFLAQRNINDLTRNSLVSVFLRVLEYYTGILFLTTNRVGSFDEAFTSRLHVSMHYPPLGPKERTQLWLKHADRVEKLREDLVVKENVREYLSENKELRKIPFNGRQIRNIFQTAVSLALFEANTSKNTTRPTLKSEHLKKIVNLSAEFQNYLTDTRGSDSENAEELWLRKDEN